MFLPLYDKNPLRIVPVQAVTIGLIVVNIGAFLYQSSLSDSGANAALLAYGMIPQVLWDTAQLGEDVARIPAEFTLMSSLFLHADWLHLGGNMLYLWVFGDNIEDSMGHLRFLAFYLICGLGAGLAHALFDPASTLPLIGASGAIGGVLGAYLMLHPRVKVFALMLRFPIYLPAYVVLGLWLALQIFLAATDGGGNTAVWAHLGGFATGVVLIPLFKFARVPLFDKGTAH